MEYGQTNAKSVAPPRLPFKESVENANQKLEKLLHALDGFHQHLFPSPIPADGGRSVEPAPLSDFAEMLDRTHSLIGRCEDRLDAIRNRF